jgi:soluble cytochrome b562
VAFSGATEGAEVGNAGDVSWTAADATSGIQSVTATVDGAAVPGDQPLALWALPLGEHTLVVTAEDNAGHITISTLVFTTTTSLAELTELTERLADSGEVTAAGERKLTQRLDQAKKHADAGRVSAAVSQLEGFIDLLSDRTIVTDVDAAEALERDALEVIDQLRG